MTGQCKVSGSAPAYAGGSIRAVFQPQGGGKPAVPNSAAAIAADGSFSLLAWDNTNAIYAPSQTTFLLELPSPGGAATTFSATATIAGSTASITALLAGAPAPSGSIGGVAISGTPTVGQVPTATSPNTATWQ